MLNDPHYRARGYPYQLTGRSYVITDGEHEVANHDDHLDDLAGRRPVLAVGSNMSPQQLARKFPGPGSGAIPVTRVHLTGFDSVYSTHFTSYGAIPATLFPSPGTEVILFVTWLNETQERHMHTTEIASENYHFCRLNDVSVRVENGPDLDHLYFYQSSRGALPINGAPVPLAEVPAANRRWQARSQDEIQSHAHGMFAPHMDFDDFVTENINASDVRRQRTDSLHAEALPFCYENVTVVDI